MGDLMEYSIIGTLYPILSIRMNKGEQIVSQTHAILSLTGKVHMQTRMYGGITKGIRRMAGGDSVFLTTLTAEEDGQEVELSDNVCGSILPLEVGDGKAYLCDKSAYLCSEPGVNLDVAFMKRVRMGLFGGEGFILERISGNGKAFLHGYGELQRKVLDGSTELKVASGKVMAVSSTIHMDVEFVKSMSNILFSGRGLFVTTLSGEGEVYLQSFSKMEAEKDGIKL